MNGPSRSGPAPARPAAGALTAAVATAGTALGAHLAVAGCLPTAAGTAVAVPATVAAALLLGRLLPERPLLRLAGGQLAGHLALSVAAACSGHAHTTGEAGGAMVLAHVAALLLLRAVLDRCADGVVTVAARLLGRLARVPAPVSLPVLRRPQPPAPAPLRALRRAVRVPVRGPPGRLLPAP